MKAHADRSYGDCAEGAELRWWAARGHMADGWGGVGAEWRREGEPEK